MAELTTLSRLKTYLGVTDTASDALLTIIIQQTSDFIENNTGREFQKAEHTDIIDGSGNEYLALSSFPVITTEDFTLYNRKTTDSNDEWEEIDSSFYLVDEYGIVEFTNGRKSRNVRGFYKAIYTAGYDFDNESTFASDAGIGDIEYACWYLCESMFNARKTAGVSSESIGDYSVVYTKAMFKDSAITEILNSYYVN